MKINVTWGVEDVLLALLAGTYVLSSYLGLNPKVSFAVISGTFPYVTLWFFTKILTSISVRKVEFLLVILISVWLCHESVLGLLQVFGNRASGHVLFGMTGSFRNPGPYGGFLGVTMSMSAVYALKNGSCLKLFSNAMSPTRDRLMWVLFRFLPVMLALVSLLLGLFVLPASGSRAGWLAFVIPVAIFIGSRPAVRTQLKHRKAVVALSVILVAACAAGAFMLKKDSASGRIHIWHIETRAIAQATVLGHGPGLSQGAYGRAQEEYFRAAERSDWERRVAGCPEYAFNEFLKIGVETGVVGLVLAVAAVMVAISGLLKRGSVFGYALMGMAVFGCFSYPLSVPSLAVFTAVLLGLGCGNKAGWSGSGANLLAMVVAFCLLLSAIPVKKVLCERAESMNIWRESTYLSGVLPYEDTVEELKQLYPSLFWNYRYLYDYGYALYKSGENIRSIEILKESAALSSDPVIHNIIAKNYEALGMYGEAEKEYLYSHNMVPCRLYPLVRLMELYGKTGRTEDAQRIRKEILAMPVNHKNRTMQELWQQVKDKELLEEEKDGDYEN